MKIVVIGGSGRVGSNVVRRLIALGHDPVHEVYHASLLGLYASAREDHLFRHPRPHEAR